MGRRKQVRPHRSVGILGNHSVSEESSKDQNASRNEENQISDQEVPFYVDVDRVNWISDEHFDISEVLLTNLNLSEEFYGKVVSEEIYRDSKYSLRFRLCNVSEYLGRIRLGHWPVLSASNICLEFFEKRLLVDEGTERETLVEMVTGSFDGPDEGVSGLVHLASLKLLTLRPVLGLIFSEKLSSLRLRVEIQKSAFDACESLLDNTRNVWKKSMMNVMAWLRPEVMTLEARYGNKLPADMEVNLSMDANEDFSAPRKAVKFDIASFYDAIKPSIEDPMLKDHLPDLLPELRPYQRRAAYWMIQQEKGASGSSGGSGNGISHSVFPLCMSVDLIDSSSKIYYNPFSGSVSLNPHYSSPRVFGGILADEMGLGKTIELLACIFAHRRTETEANANITPLDKMKVTGDQELNIRRMKRERVECVCGAVSESSRYKGLWVQCDICDAWQHADCVGYSAKRKISKKAEYSDGLVVEKSLTGTSRKNRSDRTEIVVFDETHICPLCSELIHAAENPVATGATLIVCPAPILHQWHAEIIRHTRPGSLKTLVYEGVRSTSLSSAPVIDIGEFLNANIVLTTYDVLKEDLCHDSDRHEGDRRLMRFQKRYPVIPTLLTRIFWWRICLDEAQMVESNATAATEMALRLHGKHHWCVTGTPVQRKLDDLYGLLRFLKASPFDVLRWWVDVIRDPYERGDMQAVVFTHNFFKQIMWRSSKAHVAEELQLPPQEESLSWLSLSPIEEHFYQRQHETCVTYAREVVESVKDDVRRTKISGPKASNDPSDLHITHVEAAKLLNSLLKLRQACCHPQVGSSGLRTLHQSPMTMEEILMVLVGKTKVEGEEALRKLVVSLNALAAIAIIKQEFSQAVLSYNEALAVSEEHIEDFRVDPLLKIHIHHNLTEILPLTSDSLEQSLSSGELLATSGHNICEMYDAKEDDSRPVKRKKMTFPDSDSTVDSGNLPEFSLGSLKNGSNGGNDCEVKPKTMSMSTTYQCLQLECENLKQKYLSVFSLKLSLAQQEFRKANEQVSNARGNRRSEYTTWWLESLQYIEQNKDIAAELTRKIGEAVSGTLNASRTSRIAACFRSITALTFYIQTGLDSLEDSRKTLLDRLLEIDRTMENPREEDVERVRYCPNCQINGEGVMCVHCELDELFQAYEARLFRLNKGHDGGMITSAEEAVDLQKRKSALNRFFWTLSQSDKLSNASNNGHEDDGKKRDVGEKVTVSKSPSDLEVVLGIIKTHSKALLDEEAMSAASKHLLLLEGMRKEYPRARSLAIAQAQVLRAHDEIKMATSRLRLRENEDDKSIDALSLGELDSASVEYTSEKFLAASSLSRTKGQLRYLKGLVQSKQNIHSEATSSSPETQFTVNSQAELPAERENECITKTNEETCPVCQEKLTNQKMVFQCGHVTCCKCLFAMTEKRAVHNGRIHDKWVMCPTCRQHTEFENIAYVDDRQNKSSDSSQAQGNSEASVPVKGSYSTKIEAVTRRILWIGATNPEAKVLVFSSWNDVLDVLEHALAANDITFIRMKGGRKSHVAISQFKGERSGGKGNATSDDGKSNIKSIQVLLLLIQHGANGLNLLEAQHVILVEPLLNPAAEAQAISRVHRIGQANKTLVHRFIVKDTVEESIYKLNKSRSGGSFISGNKKNQDEAVLTLKDVESLFKVSPSSREEEEQKNDDKVTGSLMHLPPSVAAALAAEKRIMDQTS